MMGMFGRGGQGGGQFQGLLSISQAVCPPTCVLNDGQMSGTAHVAKGVHREAPKGGKKN